MTPWRPLGSKVGGGGSASSFSLLGRLGSLCASSYIMCSCASFILWLSFSCDCVAVVAECQRDAFQSNGLAAAIRRATKAPPRRTWAQAPMQHTPNAIAKRKRETQTQNENRDHERRMARHTRPGARQTGRREGQGDSQEKPVCSAPRELASGEQMIARQSEQPRQENRINDIGRGVTKNLHMLMVNHDRGGLEEPKPLKGKGES